MAVTVCCPSCWKWSEFKSSMACKRCGTPLILPDGRRLDEIAAAPPDPSAPPPAYAFNGPMYAMATPPDTGLNWVSAARWVTIGYGALTVVGLLAYGFLVRHVLIPVQDPATGQIAYQSFDLGGILAITAVIVAALFALIAWLTGYVVTRVILLGLVVAAAFAVVSRMSGEPVAVAAGSITSVLFDCAFAFVLVMSLVAPADRGVSR